MSIAGLRAGGEKVTLLVQRLDETRKNLISALSDFTLAAKDLGQAVSAEMCPQ